MVYLNLFIFTLSLSIFLAYFKIGLKNYIIIQKKCNEYVKKFNSTLILIYNDLKDFPLQQDVLSKNVYKVKPYKYGLFVATMDVLIKDFNYLFDKNINYSDKLCTYFKISSENREVMLNDMEFIKNIYEGLFESNPYLELSITIRDVKILENFVKKHK